MKKKFIIFITYIYTCLFTFNKMVNADDLECNSWGDVKTDLQNVFDFMKILIPLLIVGLSTYDFIKAITAKNDKDIKKAFNRFLKRMVYAVIFFFLPILLNYVLYIFGFGIENPVCIN